MIPITKETAEYIRQQDPRVHITTVNRQGSARKKTRFVAVTGMVQRLLRQYAKLQKEENSVSL